MNPSSDIGPASSEAPPANWREALMALIAARFELIQLESKDIARESARRAILLVAACGCALFTWALLLVGGVAPIAETTRWPWSWIALGAAALHLLAGIILASAAKSADRESFPVTRAEFKKDREWIENLHTARKSND